MSETVHYRGVINPCYKSDEESLDDLCRRLISVEIGNPNVDLGDHESYIEKLKWEYHKKFVIIDNKVYSIRNLVDVDLQEDIFSARKLGIGYFFEVKYFNGGCGFDEAIKRAIDKTKGVNL